MSEIPEGRDRTATLALGGTLLLAALMLFPSLGVAPLERAEIYFLDAARGMVERGDWLTPYYRGQPFWDKPALTYWLMALSFEGFGFTPEAARLVPALATLLTLLATCWLGWQALGRRAALAGTLVLASTVAFVGFGRVAMSDSLLALFSTLALALGLAAYRGGARWAVPALGLVLGLGFLTKGPIALLLPGLGLLALAAARWRGEGRRPPLRPGPVALAAALFAVAGLGWFAVVYARLGSGPLEWFFLRENLQRFAASTYDSGRPPWYYLVTYLAQGAPWALFVPLALWRLWGPGRQAGEGEGGARLLLAWVALMLVPLSLSRGKIDYYLLPLYPALSLVVGHALAARPWGRLERGWSRGVLLLMAGGAGLALRLPATIPAGWLPPDGALRLASLGAGLLVLALALGSLRPRPGLTLGLLSGTVAALFVALTTVFLPAFRAGQPNAEIVADVLREKAYQPDLRLALCEDPVRVQRDVLFEARIAVDERCDLYAPIASRLPFLLLLDEDEAPVGLGTGQRHVRTYSYLPATAFGLRGLVEGLQPRRAALFANFESSDPVAQQKARRERRQYWQDYEAAQKRQEAQASGKAKARREARRKARGPAAPTPSR